MATLENSCSTCYKAQAPECSDYYLIGGLTPGELIHAIATDSRGRKYEVDADGEPVDVDGNLKIVFPPGLNTVSNGVLNIQIFLQSQIALDMNFCTPIEFSTCDGSFNCIELTFYKTIETPPFWQLLCLCDETPVCDGMCTINDEAILGTYNLEAMETLPTPASGSGVYMVHNSKVIIYLDGEKVTQAIPCCSGIAGFYNGALGPYKFNEDTEIWEPLINYAPIGWDFGSSFTIGGTIPDFSTGILQTTQDGGDTWGNLGAKFTKSELAEGVTRATALPWFWSRILVTLPDGCSYPSSVNTSTD